MLILVGLGMLGLGVIMMFIARPREGKAAPFLSVSIVETTYALLVTVLIGVGVRHKDRQTGTVSIVRLRLLKACWRCVRELMAFRRNLGSSLRSLKRPSAVRRAV